MQTVCAAMLVVNEVTKTADSASFGTVRTSCNFCRRIQQSHERQQEGVGGGVASPPSEIKTKLKKCERRRKYKTSILIPKMKFKEVYSFILSAYKRVTA